MSVSSPPPRPPPRPPFPPPVVFLNWDPLSSVWRAGPQPRSYEFCVACWTPTAMLWVQCGVLDPNREPASAVWRAGPHLRSCEFSVACRTSSIVSENFSERMTEDMSERMTEDMSEEMSKGYVRRYVKKNVKRYVRKMSERMSEDMSERMSKDMSERMVKDMSGRMSEDKSERMSKDMSERMSEDMSGRMSGNMSEIYGKKNARRYVRKNVKRYVRNHVRRCARKNVKRYVPKNVGRYARRYSRKNVKRYVRKNVRRYVRKNVRRYVRRNVRKICQKICQKSCQKKGQKECQKICHKECQKICQKDVRKNVRRYVRKNVKRYVRKNGKRYVRMNVRRYKDSCLYLVVSILLIASCCFLLYLARCSVALQQVLLAQLCFCARKWVWFGSHGGGCGGTSWDDLHWDCQSGGQRSWACVALQVDSCWCWAHVRMHGAAEHYTCWGFDVYHGRSRGGKQVVCGICREACSKCGGRARAGEARYSLSYFGLVLGGWSAWKGDKQRAEQGHLCRTGASTAVASIWLHGLHTPWDVVMALQTLLHFWTQLPFGGAVWCMWCVCVCGTTGVLHLWT